MATIKLNVGGKIFETTRSTLCKSQYFDILLSGKFNDTQKDVIFIDRDSDIFKHVLRLLRNPLYEYPRKYNSELDYYMIDYTDNIDININNDNIKIKNNALSEMHKIIDPKIITYINTSGIESKIFNLKDTATGNIILSPISPSQLVYMIPRVFDSITKIKVMYTDVQSDIDATYQLDIGGLTFIKVQSQYCELIDLLNDDLLNESIYDNSNNLTIVHEVPIYAKEIPLLPFQNKQFQIVIRHGVYKNVTVELFGNLYDENTRKKFHVKKYDYPIYDIIYEYMLSKHNKSLTLNLRGAVKNMIIVALDADKNRLQINDIEIYLSNNLIKHLTNRDLVKFLIQNNLNCNNNVYIIDFGNAINLSNVEINMVINVDNYDDQVEFVFYCHVSNIIIVTNGVQRKVLSY